MTPIMFCEKKLSAFAFAGADPQHSVGGAPADQARCDRNETQKEPNIGRAPKSETRNTGAYDHTNNSFYGMNIFLHNNNSFLKTLRSLSFSVKHGKKIGDL